MAKRFCLALLFILLLGFLVFYGIFIFDPFKRRLESVLVNRPVNAALSAPTVTFIDPKRGNPAGTLVLVEFGDYECLYCKEVEATLNAALRAHPDLVLVWKDLPNNSLHPQAQSAALAARCAGRQGKFWEYHDLLFEQQGRLSDSVYPGLAERLGLNPGKFNACLANKEENAVVLRNVEEAMALGVDATPYFFLGSLRISGQVSPEELEALVASAEKLTKKE